MNHNKSTLFSSFLIVLAMLGLTMATFACKKPATDDTTRDSAMQADKNTDTPPSATDEAQADAAAANDGTETMHDAADEDTNWFGGPVYDGEPALEATVALVRAGGGTENFSFQTALVSMLGQEAVDAEVAKLTEQYGEDAVKRFLDGIDLTIHTALEVVDEQGIELSEAPKDLEGVELAKALINAGKAPDGTFWSGYLFDHAISHERHVMVMGKVDNQVGHEADGETHKILNQAMYDVAQKLEMTDVKLASFH